MSETDDKEQFREEESVPFDEALRRILNAPPQHKKTEEKPPPAGKGKKPEKGE